MFFFGILPYVKITSLYRDANSACKFGRACFFRHTEADGQPSKKSKKSDAKGSVALPKESPKLGCVSQDSYPRKPTLRESGKFGSKHAVKFSKSKWHHIKILERKGPSRGVIQKCEPHECSTCAPRFEDRTQDETLHQERCARRAAWDLAKNVYKLKRIRRKLRFALLLKLGQRRLPLQNLRGTRIRGRLRSIDARAEHKGPEPRRNGDSAEVQEHHNGGNGQWRSADKQGSTSIRSRSWSLRDGANTRRRACRPVIRQVLRRSQLYL